MRLITSCVRTDFTLASVNVVASESSTRMERAEHPDTLQKSSAKKTGTLTPNPQAFAPEADALQHASDSPVFESNLMGNGGHHM
jgi:hypothetical protein